VLWADAGSGYDAVYASLCAHTIPALLDAAAVSADSVLLDVGTGTGTVARAAVARGAKVTAVDAEPSMLDLARGKAPEAEFLLAVVPTCRSSPGRSTPSSATSCSTTSGGRRSRCGLRNVAKPGGRVAFTLWPAERSAGRKLFSRTGAETEGWIPRQMPPLVLADDYPRTEEGLTGLFREVGLADVTTSVLDWEHLTTAEEWWMSMGSGVGPSGRTYQAQSAEVRAAFHENYLRIAAEMTDEDGTLRLPYRALLAVGTAVDSA